MKTTASLDSKLEHEQIAAIAELQAELGLTEIQERVNSGVAWQLEGAYGRQAMEFLKTGLIFLPDVRHRDAYGSTVPSRDDLKPGTTGTLLNSVRFWKAHEFENEETF